MRPILAFLIASFLALDAVSGGSVLPLDPPLARQIVDPARHDRPTIVALWSTECPHCKKNLALYARLAQQEKRLRLISVATEPLWEGVAEPLDKLGIHRERYAYGDAAPEALAHALDPGWHGELPRTLVFDGRGGRLAVSGVLQERRLRQALGLDPRVP